MMRGVFFLYLCACTLFIPASQSEGQIAERAFHLVYLLPLDEVVHPAQVQMLQRVWQDHRSELKVTGLVRLSAEVAEVDRLKDLIVEHDLGYELVGVEQADRGDAAVYWQGALQGEGAYAVLLDAAQRPMARGAGAQLPHILAALGPRGASTEVDESTWGKIKVLFE